MAIGSVLSLAPSVDAGTVDARTVGAGTADAGTVGACTAASEADEGTLSAALLAGAGVVDSWPCGGLIFSSVGFVSAGADSAADGVLFWTISGEV
jgi:hypothetical protein